MAEINFRNLIPGKRYKIVIKANSVVKRLDNFPSIDFIAPEAPPRARNFRLSVNTVIKTKILQKDRKLKIYKYKIEIVNGKRIVVISTSRLDLKKKNRVKPGDRVSVTLNSDTYGINVSNVKALSRKNKNRIRYEHPNQTLPLVAVGWQEYTYDNNQTKDNYPITHHNGRTVTIKKAKYVRIRIPKPILQNLTWNDEVKDFVFIIYRKGKKRSRLGRKDRYLWDKDDDKLFVLSHTPPRLNQSGVNISPENDAKPGQTATTINLSDFPDGHPATFLKEITDDKFYEFRFIVARYIKTTEIDPATGNPTYTWTGYWIERNTPFLKKRSRPRGWSNR